MAALTHPTTGLLMGDPQLSPFEVDDLPTQNDIAAATEGLILSASGWRKVFASPGAGLDQPRASWAPPRDLQARGPDEDSLSPAISTADAFLAGAMAMTFVEYLRERTGNPAPGIILGIDARPTGPAIAEAMGRVFLGLGAKPRYLFIVAAPEIMAYARACGERPTDHEERAEGFCYISASHNPPGHNGVKFGVGGGVLPGVEANKLIESFRKLVASGELVKRVLYAAEDVTARDVGLLFSSATGWKRKAVSAYTLFAREIVTGTDDVDGQEAFLEAMSKGSGESPVGVVAEFNGSARCLSIDEDFLSGAGARYLSINGKPRAFAHRIVPEGESLEPCCRALEAAHGSDPAYVAGYVPDCDGDRGNLVIWDDTANGGKGKARPLAAQEVFALCLVAETAQLVREGKSLAKAAVAVNDATSMRVEAIARAFGIEVFRAETGEPNIVGLAERLRGEGYTVRILGEGSNGGNITFPSAVRDPLATVSVILKLLTLRGSGPGASDGLFYIWLEKSGQLARYRPDFGLADILASLPAYATTSAFEPVAVLRIASTDHASLKARYHGLFAAAWEKDRRQFASRFGAVAWEAFASKGPAQLPVGEDFASSGKGGLRIVFKNAEGRAVAFVWMRGSGTEPVFRVMADVSTGRAEDETWLLDWHRDLVLEADRG